MSTSQADSLSPPNTHTHTHISREEGTNKHTLHHLGQLHHTMGNIRRLHVSLLEVVVLATKDMRFTHKRHSAKVGRWTTDSNLPDLHKTQITRGVKI